jgi:hypothetical protein
LSDFEILEFGDITPILAVGTYFIVPVLTSNSQRDSNNCFTGLAHKALATGGLRMLT